MHSKIPTPRDTIWEMI